MLRLPSNIKENYIGEGSYGVVIKCSSEIPRKDTKINNNNLFIENALKINLKFKNEKIIGISSLKELSLLLKLKTYSNENEETFVINLIDFIESSFIEKDIEPILNKVTDGKKKNFDKIHFLFDFYQYDLEAFVIENKKKLTEKVIINIFEDILLGLYWCYLNDVIHRDLKLSNILVKTEKKGSYKSLKICDFGLGTYMKEIKDFKTSSPNVTSYYYRAPEIFKWKENDEENSSFSYTFKIDYWALGAILLNIISGEVKIDLFKDGWKQEINRIKDKVKKKFNDTFIEKIFDLIENDLLVEEERKGIKVLLKNPLLDQKKIAFYTKKFRSDIKIRTEKEQKEMEVFIEEKNTLYMLNKEYLDHRNNFIDFLIEIINDKPKWYKEEIIYHSLYTFDKLSIYLVSKKEAPTNCFVAIVYIFYKFFSTLILIDFESFRKSFFSSSSSYNNLKKDEIITEIEEIEKIIFEDIYKYQLYEKTEYEFQNKFSNIKKYLLNEQNNNH